MENITVNVFDDVLYLAWEFVYLIFFTPLNSFVNFIIKY